MLMTQETKPIIESIKRFYKQGLTDYHLQPIILADSQGKPIGRIKDNDAVIFCCRRGEREIQLTRAFVDKSFNEFSTKNFKKLTFVIMKLYHEMFRNLPLAFKSVSLKNTLGEIISKSGLKQARITESEKFAHVTYFFNGGENRIFPGEYDIEIPSPKGISFEKNPELNISKVTQKLSKLLNEGEHALIVVNFTNGDIIGHLDNRQANIKCAEAIDKHLGITLQASRSQGYMTMITADHGLLENMLNSDGSPSVSHSTNPVPFILIPPKGGFEMPTLKDGGRLADVAPTILEIMGLPKPQEMTGQSLLIKPLNENIKKVLLVILDGWGIGHQDVNNPIFVAQTPVMDTLLKKYPNCTLKASGEAVGLKPGMKGNSEAGHINIGAGRIVLQDEVKIEKALMDGSFYNNEVFLKAIKNTRERKGALHLLALLSKKSSHGTMDSPIAILKMAKKEGLKEVYIHLIFDGRSTKPGSAPRLLTEFEQEIEKIGLGKIVTGIGRGFALDRDNNYLEKTKVAYDALVFGKGYIAKET